MAQRIPGTKFKIRPNPNIIAKYVELPMDTSNLNRGSIFLALDNIGIVDCNNDAWDYADNQYSKIGISDRNGRRILSIIVKNQNIPFNENATVDVSLKAHCIMVCNTLVNDLLSGPVIGLGSFYNTLSDASRYFNISVALDETYMSAQPQTEPSGIDKGSKRVIRIRRKTITLD